MEQIMIKPLTSDEEMFLTVQIIRNAFKTVADEMGLTPENAPTNPAFIKIDQMNQLTEKGVIFFGIFADDRQVGCMGLENAGGGVFYLEKLAVLPELRHLGLGKKLLDFAFDYAKRNSVNKISIAMVNENTVLKEWYLAYGFEETGIKNFSHLPFTVCFMEKGIS